MSFRKRFPRIEVLLPFHKVDAFLLKSIDSTLASNGVEIRILLVDDRVEKDSCRFIPKKIANQIEVIPNDIDHGYGPALREGTNFVSESFVGLMNSDDEIHPDKFKLQLERIGDADVSITRLERRRISNRRSISVTGDFTGDDYFPELLLLGAYGANATWTMRSDWWKKNSFFDTAEALDWRIALRTFRTAEISFINQPLYYYTRHKNQTTQTLSSKDARDFDLLFTEWRTYFQLIFEQYPNFDSFQVLAAPWLRRDDRLNIQQIRTVADSMLQILNRESIAKSETFFPIIQRRFILAALQNNVSFPDRLEILNGSKKEVVKLLLDILKR
jgi:glycosyltransferase involved in cell wall biosynthesis